MPEPSGIHARPGTIPRGVRGRGADGPRNRSTACPTSRCTSPSRAGLDVRRSSAEEGGARGPGDRGSHLDGTLVRRGLRSTAISWTTVSGGPAGPQPCVRGIPLVPGVPEVILDPPRRWGAEIGRGPETLAGATQTGTSRTPPWRRLRAWWLSCARDSELLQAGKGNSVRAQPAPSVPPGTAPSRAG